jgi:hypothetical protein
MTIIRSIGALLCVAALTACEKNAVQEITGPVPAARIMFFNFGLGAPAVNFYANDTKMTAIGSTACTPANDPACSTTGIESTNGVAFGSVAAGGLYTGIAPGQYTLSGRIAAATDKNLPISQVATTVEPGKQYSYYQSGVYNTATKSVDAFVVEDALPAALDYSGAYVRFVNAIHNSSPMALFARDTLTKQEYAVGGPVAYKNGGAFVLVPAGVYDFAVRAPGGTTTLIARNVTASTGGVVTLSRPRVYTITARGDMTVTGTTAVNRPALDSQTNR